MIEVVFEDSVRRDLSARVEQVVGGAGGARDEHLCAVRHRDRRGPHAPWSGGRHALLQSCAGAAARRDVRAERSADEAFETAYAFGERIGKDPIACHDTPGFVVNRILIPVLNDAVRVLEEGTASPEDIDKGMKLGTGWLIGPLALIDLIGIDVHVHVCEALWNAFREPRFAPPPRLVRMVQAGLLGRKSGRGFYRYDE